MKAPQDIILKPVITEQSTDLLPEGKYTFKVAKDANKLERELDEAAMLKDVSHMPARVKCAELAWRTLSEMLKDEGAGVTTTE